tara:strand:- start:37 stop:1689 length:1653 start_codon:yes stop_codon:yes gene_type:complete
MNESQVRHCKYYHIATEEQNVTTLYSEIPSGLDSSTAVLEFSYLNDSGKTQLNKKLIKKKKGTNDYQLSGYISVDCVNRIYVSSEKIIDELTQQQYDETIDFPEKIYNVNKDIFLEKKREPEQGQLSIDNTETTQNLKIDDSQKIHSASSEYNTFEGFISFSLVVLNFIFKKNLFGPSTVESLPRGFKPFPHADNVYRDFVQSMNQIRDELFTTNTVSYKSLLKLHDFYPEELDLNALLLWGAIVEVLTSEKGEFKIEEVRDLYVDNNRKHTFNAELLKRIGKRYQENILESFDDKGITSESEKNENVKSDQVIKFLGKIYLEYDDLDLHSDEILNYFNKTGNVLLIQLGTFLHDLIRYGDDISIFRKKFKNLNTEKTDHVLTAVAYASFMGLSFLPKTVKQNENSSFLFSSIESDLIAAKSKISKNDTMFESIKNWVFEYLMLDDENRYTKIGDVKYEIIFEDIRRSFSNKDNGYHIEIPLRNEFGFIFLHKDFVEKKTLTADDAENWIKFMNKYHNKEFSRYVLNFEKELSDIDRIKFHSDNNGQKIL